MRTACLRAIMMGLFLAGFCSVIPRSAAQQPVTLINYNATWRYDQSGTDLGTAWRQISYPNESTWPQGPGLLQGGEGTAYPQPFGTTMAAPTGKITYYFRHTFTYNGTTNGLTLYATNFIDDGAVIYLNGVEAARIRMPTGTINFTTVATGGPANEGDIDLVTIPAGLLRVGQNVMAVEVHQVNNTSSDVVWGTRLVAIQPTFITIVSQPQSQTATVGEAVTFSVGISGGPAFYQWFKDGAVIPGQTASNYTINAVAVGNAGTYSVRVSNSVNVVTSTGAILTIIQDTQGPEILTARVTDSGLTNQIVVAFDENLQLSTVTTNNLRVVVGGTSGAASSFVIISNAPTVIGRNVLLRVGGANWNLFGNYYVIANNIADARGNLIAPNSVIPISWPVRTNVTQMSSLWDYYALNIFDPDGAAIYTGNQWYRTNYTPNASLWGTGDGIFWFDQDATAQLCAGDGLSLNNISFQEVPTLFRSTFNLGTNYGSTAPISGTLQLRFMCDDGMILYLNGQEIYRYNMPAGQLTSSTKATAAIGTPTCIPNVEVQVTNLVPRLNYLAAAVCQASTSGADIYFGLELDGIFFRTGMTPTNGLATSLRLTATKPTTNTVRISWPNAAPNIYYGYNLQSRPVFTNGNWQTVSNQSNGIVIPASQAAQYYRLEKGPNSPK